MLIYKKWKPFPKYRPPHDGWYLVTCAIPFHNQLEDKGCITYTRSLYWSTDPDPDISDRGWIDRCLWGTFMEFNVHVPIKDGYSYPPKSGELIDMYNPRIKGAIYQSDIVVAWKELDDPYISNDIKYCNINNACELYPEAYPSIEVEFHRKRS